VDHQAAATVIILEDEALIAIDVEEQLRSAGFDVVGVFSSCAEASDWLQSGSPDVAILDIDLRDGNCAAIARLLNDRHVPFVVHSGSFRDSGEHDESFLAGKWVGKPCPPSELYDAVRSSLSGVPDQPAMPKPNL
jgi:DNA-binding response OmpR family regulator